MAYSPYFTVGGGAATGGTATPYQASITPGYQAPTGTKLDWYTGAIDDARARKQQGGAAQMAAYNQIMNGGGAYEDAVAAGLKASQAIMYPGFDPNDPTYGHAGSGGSQNAPIMGSPEYTGSFMQTKPNALGGLPGASQFGTGGGAGSSPYASANPYLGSMADEIGRRTQQGLTQAFNGIRSNFVGGGQLGSDRQGVAEGVATRGAMDSLQGNLAGLFSGQYNADANRDLSRYQGDQSFYTNQRGQDQAGLALGANLFNQGMDGEWNAINNATQTYSPFTGYGNSTQSTNGGDPDWMKILGGMGAGYQWWQGLNK